MSWGIKSNDPRKRPPSYRDRASADFKEYRVKPFVVWQLSRPVSKFDHSAISRLFDSAFNLFVGGGRYQNRSAIPSATRSAFAMIVSVGLTAAIDGKKLASVT